jgi:serine/threonine-protein kinase
MQLADHLNAALAGTYVIERVIGRGGMATVYLARDLKHQRQLALKVLDPELGAVVGAERLQPVIADFGIALAVSNAGGQRVTQTGLSLGTPQYMSPEMTRGAPTTGSNRFVITSWQQMIAHPSKTTR